MALSITYRGFRGDATDGTSYSFTSCDFGTAASSRAVLVAVTQRRSGSVPPAATLTVTIGGVSATQLGQSYYQLYGIGVTAFIARVPSGTSGTIAVTASASLTACSIVWYSFDPASLTAVDVVTAQANASSLSAQDVEVVNGGAVFAFLHNAFSATQTAVYNGVDTPVGDLLGTGGTTESYALHAWHADTTENVLTNDAGFNSGFTTKAVLAVSFGVAAGPIEVAVTDTVTTSETIDRSATRDATLSDSIGVKYRYPFETTVTDFLSVHDVSGPEVLGDGQDTAVIADTLVPAFPVTITEGVRLSDTAVVAPLFNPVLVEPISVQESSNLGSPAALTTAFVAADAASLSTVSEVVISGPPFRLAELIAPTVTYYTAVASTARLAEDFDYAYGATTVETPTISVTALGAVRPLPVVLEQIRWTETSATKLTYTPVLSRGIAVADALRPSIPRTLTDTVAIAGALLSQHAIRVAERLNLLDPLVARMAYAQTIAQTISVYDTFNNFFGGAVSDSLVTSDSLASNYKLRLPMAESAAIGDSLQKHFVVRIISADQVAISHTQALQCLFRPTLLDHVEISAAYISPNENFLTWVVNPGTGAVTEYTNFAFNSFAAFGNTYLAAKSDGLYVLHGANDAGTSIVAQIRTALLQMNGGRLSALKGVYLGVRGNGTYQLKIIDGTGATSVYQFVVQNMETTKIRVGKGLRARYFAFELQNINGNDFDLDTIEIVPILAGRRV